jgi:signal transduction histidine kinase
LEHQLEQALSEKTAELRQSQRWLRALVSELILAEQRERKRLANELHDHLQQILVLGKLIIGQGKRFANGVPDCEIVLKKVEDILSDALTYSRTLVTELSPPVLHHHGLTVGLKWLAEYIKKRYELTVTVLVPEDQGLNLPEDQVILLFQSVRELLISSSKHAGTSEATV